MPRIFVTPYQFKIARKFRPTEPELLGNILDEDGAVDLLEIVARYAESMASQALVAEDDRIFQVERYDVANRVVRGRNIGGEYGYEAERVNIKTRSKIGRKQKDEADMIPLYYHVFIPRELTTGVVFFQSLGHFSASSKFLAGLKAFVQMQLPQFTFSFYRAVDGEMLNLYLEKIRAVILTKRTLPPEMDQNFVSGGYTLDDYSMEVRVHPKRKQKMSPYIPPFVRDRVLKYLHGEIGKSDIFHFPGIDADDIKIVTEYDGHACTISLNDPTNINVRIDLTDQVRASDGHADYEKIYREVTNLQDKYVR